MNKYDFAQAYVMMKDGKWMKPLITGCPVKCYRFTPYNTVEYLTYQGISGKHEYEGHLFSSAMIDGQWEEVQL